MSSLSKSWWGRAWLIAAMLLPGLSVAQTNFQFRVMAANLTSGSAQSYEAPGIRLFQGLQPDIVAIQEFRYNSSSSPGELRALVDAAFGTNFHFYCEPYTGAGDIPNGVVSRWPISGSGSWDDPVLGNRGFAWAQIDLPGSNDLYVVSVHFYTDNATDRNTEAATVRSRILENFPTNAWIIVAGDLNTGSRSESAVATLASVASDSPVPVDQAGNFNTSASRSSPYDYVLQSPSLAANLVPVQIGAVSFPAGLVFDSRVFSPLSSVTPIQPGDSGAPNMQHMAVIKQYQAVAGGISNPPPAAVSTNLVVQWGFNNTNASLTSPPPSVGAGTLSLVGGTTSAYVSGSGSTDTNAGNFAWNTTTYPAVTSGSQTAGIQIQVSTVGWSNLVVRWDQRNSATASKYLRLQYATNGITFVDHPALNLMPASSVFSAFTNSLEGIPGVENNPNLVLRLVTEFAPGAGGYAATSSGNTYGSAGTIRYDMLTVQGVRAAPIPLTLAATRTGADVLQISVAGQAGQACILQRTTNPAAAAWTPVVTNTVPFSLTESNLLSQPGRYYRAQAAP